MFRPFNPNIPAFNLAISTLFRNPSYLLPHLTIPTFTSLPIADLSHHLNHPSPTSPTAQPPRLRALILDKDNTLTPPESLEIPDAYLQKLKEIRHNADSPFNIEKNPDGVLIVSNTAGSNPRHPIYEAEARFLEEKLKELRIPVFRAGGRIVQPSSSTATEQSSSSPTTTATKQTHESNSNSSNSSKPTPLHTPRPFKKPFSYHSILSHLYSRSVIQHPSEIVVVGDRLGTDVLMASLMGSWSVWVREGVTVSVGDKDRGKEGMDYRGFLARREASVERYLTRRGVRPKIPEGSQG